MGDHTFIENAKIALVQDQASITASVVSAKIDTIGARGNAILLALAAFAFSGTNKITVSLVDSDDDVTYTPVVNGGNGGAELNVVIGRTNGGDAFRNANGTFVDSVAIDGTTDANGAGDKVSDVYVLEYTGAKRYAKLDVVVAGTVAVDATILHAQSALNVLPNIIDAG